MKKTSLISAVLLVLLAACEGDASDDGSEDVITVRGEVSAVLRGEALPDPKATFTHDELWLDLEPGGALTGFSAHPWEMEARQSSYDVHVEFAPTDVPGEMELLAARVCFATCGDHPEKDGCAGDCFSELKSGQVDVLRISEDGRHFDLTFDFEVRDLRGRVVKVTDGKARTR